MYAGFWVRLGAYIIDYILINLGVLVILLILAGLEMLLDSLGIPQQTKETVLSIVGVPAYVTFPWLYYALFESSIRQATPGKMAVGVKVVDLDGNRVSFGRATARFWLKILSAIILLMGYVMIEFTKKKQGLHDLIARTLVVRVSQTIDANKQENDWEVLS